MSDAWSITDDELHDALQAWVDLRNDSTIWHVHTFQNDYTPVPGDDISAYTESTYIGYSAQNLVMDSWSITGTTADVVTADSGYDVTFTASSSGFSSQPVYGYYVTDNLGNYKWGERFADTRTVRPLDQLVVHPKMLMQNAA